MPVNTTKGWPYVLPADPIADYPVTSQALATKAEASVPFALATGSVACVFTAATQSGATTVTLPVGRFSVPPMIFFGTQTSLRADLYTIRLTGAPTATSFQVIMNGATAPSVTITAAWLAVQMLTSAAAG